MKILFVCTGNTCRSVIAQGLMQKKAKENNLDINCESAGTCAFVGDRADETTLILLKERGIDLSSHRSRRLNEYMADEYDLFVCMSPEHKEAVRQFADEKKICILGEGIWNPEDDDLSIYRLCADKIDRELDKLTEKICCTEINMMKSEDVKDIAEIEKECFSSPWSEKGISEELGNENAVFFVASYLGETAGYMGMHTVLDECYVANIAVKEKFRRKGIGRKLLSFAENKAKERNCSFISLEVRENNKAAISLYSSEGYENMGMRKDFYTDPKENAVIMTKNL